MLKPTREAKYIRQFTGTVLSEYPRDLILQIVANMMEEILDRPQRPEIKPGCHYTIEVNLAEYKEEWTGTAPN